MVITGNNEEEINDLKRKLFMEFEIKDLGNLKYFLGIEVYSSRQRIFINQTNHRLQTKEEGKLVGKLIYGSSYKNPEIPKGYE